MPKDLSELTDFELATRKKELAAALILISICFVILIITAIFSFSKKGFSGTTTLPIAFLPIAIINIRNIKNIQAEQASRKK